MARCFAKHGGSSQADPPGGSGVVLADHDDWKCSGAGVEAGTLGGTLGGWGTRARGRSIFCRRLLPIHHDPCRPSNLCAALAHEHEQHQPRA